MQNSCTNTRLNIWTVAIVVTKFLWMFYYVIWLLHTLYSITIECYVLYWICMHYTVLLNLCHDLALVLEQFGMMCCLFENWCCFNLMDWNVNGNWLYSIKWSWFLCCLFSFNFAIFTNLIYMFIFYLIIKLNMISPQFDFWLNPRQGLKSWIYLFFGFWDVWFENLILYVSMFW